MQTRFLHFYSKGTKTMPLPDITAFPIQNDNLENWVKTPYIPTANEKAGIAGASAANPVVLNNDSRLSSGLNTEQVQDVVAAMIQNTATITKNYNDVANTLELTAVGGGGSTATRALQFDGTKHHHVNFGALHAINTNYADFFIEVLIKPTGTGYWWSDGNGGAHIFLGGVNGNEANGYAIDGNIWNYTTGAGVSYSSITKIRHNEWAHVAVWSANGLLGVSINGVPDIVVPWTGVRRTPNLYEVLGFMGGSDHQNFSGKIKALRLFENELPYTNPHNTVVRPAVEHILLNEVGGANAVLIFDAEFGTQDLSAGMGGKQHNGYLNETLSDGATGFHFAYDGSRTGNRNPSARPVWVDDAFAYTGTAAQKTQIAGTRIYDDFSGADSHYGKDSVLSLGTTRIGAKTWNTGGAYGKNNGTAFANATSPGNATITDSSADGTIILRKPSVAFPTGLGAAYRLIFRFTDASNLNVLYIDEYGTGVIFTTVGGTQVNTGNFSFGTNWTEAKIVLSGATVTTFRDNTQVDTKSVSANQTATGKGFNLSLPILKVSEFGVI